MPDRLGQPFRRYRLTGLTMVLGTACGAGLGSLAGDLTLFIAWTVLTGSLGAAIGFAGSLTVAPDHRPGQNMPYRGAITPLDEQRRHPSA